MFWSIFHLQRLLTKWVSLLTPASSLSTCPLTHPRAQTDTSLQYLPYHLIYVMCLFFPVISVTLSTFWVSSTSDCVCDLVVVSLCHRNLFVFTLHYITSGSQWRNYLLPSIIQMSPLTVATLTTDRWKHFTSPRSSTGITRHVLHSVCLTVSNEEKTDEPW